MAIDGIEGLLDVAAGLTELVVGIISEVGEDSLQVLPKAAPVATTDDSGRLIQPENQELEACISSTEST